MKIIRIIGKGIKDAFRSVFRNFSLSIASISCIAITLVIVAVALIATYNVNNITKEIEGVLEIVVFIDRDADKDDEETVGGLIENVDNNTIEVNKNNNNEIILNNPLSKSENKVEIINEKNNFNLTNQPNLTKIKSVFGETIATKHLKIKE